MTLTECLSREYLEYEEEIVLEPVPLEKLLKNHVPIAADLNAHKPVKLFKDYLAHGYYPFYKEDKGRIHTTFQDSQSHC